MPRQRFIFPSIWEDPDLARLDAESRLLYIACFSLADDDGRLIGEPVHLRSAVFKYQTMTDRKILELRDRLAETCGDFRVYNVRGTDYIAFKNWSEYQHPKYPKPSKLPPPPWQRKRRNHASLSEKSSGNGSGSDSHKVAERLGE
jgi:hypothetical protein